MPLPTFPLEGGCRCDGVRIRLTAPPLLECACHCRGCQRMASSAFSLTAICAASAFEVTKGEPVLGGMRAPELAHWFCGACMTWMFTRPAALPDIVNVRPTMLDDHAWFEPYVETYTSTRLPFATTGAQRSYDTFPPMDTFAAVIEAYRAHRGWASAAPR